MTEKVDGKHTSASGQPPSGLNKAIQPRPGRHRALRRLALAAAVPLLLVGCSEEQPAAPKADLGAGKAIAEAQCVGCHGLDGEGAAPGIPDLAAQDERYLFQSLIAYKEGRRTHAALRDIATELSEADMRNAAGYYAALPPLAQPAKEAPDIPSPYAKGEAAANACAGCHNQDGNSTTPGVPSLAGQQPLYFASAVRAYLRGTRDIATKEMLRGLSAIDVQSLALYYAAQTPALRQAPTVGDPAAGEPLSARCGGCHGAHGVSHDAATPSLAGQDADYLMRAIKAYRNHAREHDVMLDTNTDEEIEDLAAYYSVQASKAAESKPISLQDLAQKCDRCHGPEVENLTLVVPKIAGQDRSYLMMAMRAYRDDKRESSVMHKMSLPYSDLIIESIAAFYAAQAPR